MIPRPYERVHKHSGKGKKGKLAKNVKHDEITEIINELKSISNELIFISMSKTETTTNINLDIRPKEFNEIMKITEVIKQKFRKSKTIVARNSNLNL